MAGRKRFTIPEVDDIEEENVTKKSSKSAFKLYKSSSGIDKPQYQGTSQEKDEKSSRIASEVKRSSDEETRKRYLLKALDARNLKNATPRTLNTSDTSTTSSQSMAHPLATGVTTATCTVTASMSGLNSVYNYCEDAPSTSQNLELVGQAKETCGRPVAGRTFKDAFAFLKDTKHYEEAVAKVKEIEAAKPAASKIAVATKSKPNAILVNPRQKGNPILMSVRCVPWEYSDIIPDYVLGATTCVVFLSLRYHHFNPDYVHERLRQLGSRYQLRILLVLVDVKDPHQTIKELTKMAIMADCTMMLAWSSEEAGRYLETYKVYENKPADALQGQTEGDYMSKLQECLTTIKGVNKTDVITLSSTFGSLAEIANTPKEDLAFLPGFGPLKAKRLQSTFHEPFIKKKKKADDNTQEIRQRTD